MLVKRSLDIVVSALALVLLAHLLGDEGRGSVLSVLKAAGASLQAPGAPRDAFNQAEGYRYLARLARAAVALVLVRHDGAQLPPLVD